MFRNSLQIHGKSVYAGFHSNFLDPCKIFLARQERMAQILNLRPFMICFGDMNSPILFYNIFTFSYYFIVSYKCELSNSEVLIL